MPIASYMGMRCSKDPFSGHLAHWVTRRATLSYYAKQRGLSHEHRHHLQAVVAGHRGEGLRTLMETRSLDAQGLRFEHQAGVAVHCASIRGLQQSALTPTGKASAA